MSYENATSTKLLATHCACCTRPLRDAVSVEIGMGLICRERHGYNEPRNDAIRARANKLIHDIAARRNGTEVGQMIDELEELGFARVADVISDRVQREHDKVVIRIEQNGDALVVLTPFCRAAIKAWRRIPGRRFDLATCANIVPTTQKVALFELLKTYFPGKFATGPKGDFRLPPKPRAKLAVIEEHPGQSDVQKYCAEAVEDSSDVSMSLIHANID